MKHDNHIVLFFHCKECLDEIPFNESPGSYSRLDCGWTKEGFQVYCRRHKLNVIHVDFNGSQHHCLPDDYKLKETAHEQKSKQQDGEATKNSGTFI